MSLKIFADLHNHTMASDGDLSAQDLVSAVRDLGVQAMGITDHDTLKGLEEALVQGDAQGIEILPGVEISVRFNRPFFTGTLHVLAYFARERLADRAFVDRFNTLLSRGRGDGLVRARIDRINAVFGPSGQTPVLERAMTFEDIEGYGANISRRHFALALTQRFGIKDREAVSRIIGNASPAYVPSGVGLPSVADFLKAEPVVGVLAHPAAGSFPGGGHYKEVLPPVEIVERLLPELLAAGVAGLEVFYPGHTPEHREQLLSWAATYDLLVTGGSDCHDLAVRPPGIAGIGRERYLALRKAVYGKHGSV